MGRKSKLTGEQIAKSIEMIDNKEISLRKRAKELEISHPQLRDSIIKYRKLLKENDLTNTTRNKNIDEISKDMDQELYKDHIENDQNPDQEIDQKTYSKVVDSLREQFNVPEKPTMKPVERITKEKAPYVSLTFLWHMHEHIYGKSDGHKNSRDALLDKFIEELKNQKKIVRGS